MRLFTICSGILLGLPLSALSQQVAAPPTQAKLADCVRDIKGDSVALYYDKRYELTPGACATFCRYTRLDPTGSIYGEVRDYRLAGQQLAFRQHYDHGVRQGSYEAYYPNGQLQMQGTFTQDEPSGEWRFWYASGKPWQVLRWDAKAVHSWRYVAYWDSTGQQLLANGNGHWQEINVQQRHHIEGRVVNELPDGEWLFCASASDATQPLTVETYEKGVFKKGRNLSKLGAGTYRDRPHLGPSFEDPSAAGVRYKRGLTCAERARQEAASTAISQRMQQQGALMARVKTMEQPRPDGDYRAYLAELVRKLSDAPSMKSLLLNPSYSAIVEADIDAFGKLGNFRAASADIQRIFTQIVPPLGRWRAAQVNGAAVSSRVKFSLSVLDAHWQIQYQPGGIDVSKATMP